MSTRTNFTTTHPSNIDPDGLLATPGTLLLVAAVLVDKLGGSVEIAQEDIDRVAFRYLVEQHKYTSTPTPGKSVLHTVILALQNTAAQTMQ